MGSQTAEEREDEGFFRKPCAEDNIARFKNWRHAREAIAEIKVGPLEFLVDRPVVLKVAGLVSQEAGISIIITVSAMYRLNRD